MITVVVSLLDICMEIFPWLSMTVGVNYSSSLFSKATMPICFKVGTKPPHVDNFKNPSSHVDFTVGWLTVCVI